MDVREFRIGNKVDLYGSIATIEPVDFSGIGIAIKKGKPIPLTEEWLLKLGFFEDNTYLNIGEVRYYIGEFGTYLDEQVWWNEEIISDHIKYVHQLQNLYHALTNEELTLNK